MNNTNLGVTSTIYPTPQDNSSHFAKILEFASSNQCFGGSLKLSKPARFEMLKPIIVSYSSRQSQDIVIGIFYRDKEAKYSPHLGATANYK